MATYREYSQTSDQTESHACIVFEREIAKQVAANLSLQLDADLSSPFLFIFCYIILYN